MLPTQKTPPRRELTDLSVLVYGRPKAGKCLSGDTQIPNPTTGRPTTLRDMVAAEAGEVLTLRADGHLVPATPSAYLAHPPAQLYRLAIESGQAIEATAAHPFWTPEGWKPLGQLQAGDRVAVTAHTPSGYRLVFEDVAAITPTEIAPVYDLTIDGTHSFVANDFVVHNSSFCAQAEGVLFLATEAGLNHLDTYQVPIQTWEEMLAACAEIAAGKHPFTTVVMDTVDNAYRLCMEYVNRQLGIKHESEAPYGRAYGMIAGEFTRVLTKLSLLPYGLYLISHAQETTVETRTGTLTRVVPTLPDKARKVVLGLVDLVLFVDLETDTTGGETRLRRVLRTKPTPHYEAGDRTGRLPETIDLNFAAFMAAFQAATAADGSAL